MVKRRRQSESLDQKTVKEDGELVKIRRDGKKASVPVRNPNDGVNEKETSYNLRGPGQVIYGES